MPLSSMNRCLQNGPQAFPPCALCPVRLFLHVATDFGYPVPSILPDTKHSLLRHVGAPWAAFCPSRLAEGDGRVLARRGADLCAWSSPGHPRSPHLSTGQSQLRTSRRRSQPSSGRRPFSLSTPRIGQSIPFKNLSTAGSQCRFLISRRYFEVHLEAGASLCICMWCRD